jgi:hypothetical protein
MKFAIQDFTKSTWQLYVDNMVVYLSNAMEAVHFFLKDMYNNMFQYIDHSM